MMLAELSRKCPSLVPKEGLDDIVKEKNQVLIKGNVALWSTRLPTWQISITARTSEQFAIIRSYFSSTFGICIRRRAPSLKEADNGEGISELQQTYIKHMVDADLSNQEEISSDEN